MEEGARTFCKKHGLDDISIQAIAENIKRLLSGAQDGSRKGKISVHQRLFEEAKKRMEAMQAQLAQQMPVEAAEQRKVGTPRLCNLS